MAVPREGDAFFAVALGFRGGCCVGVPGTGEFQALQPKP